MWFTDMKQLSFFSYTIERLYHCLYDHPGFVISVFAGMSKYFNLQTHRWLDFGVFTTHWRCFGQSAHLLHYPSFIKWGFLELQRLSQISVHSNSRKMFCNWFQTLIILWKAALRQRLNSLKARVKYVVVIKNNRTTRAFPTYQSFVVKARNTHVEFVHHLNRAQKLLMTMQLILVLLQAPFSAVAFH